MYNCDHEIVYVDMFRELSALGLKKIHTILSDHHFSAEIIYVLINIPQNRLWKIKNNQAH